MASSWIKVEVITPDKPEIFQIAEILNIDPDAVLGKLVRIWAWADQQTVDGNAGSVTKGVLDRIAFITGFADALISVGWLAYVDGKLALPNFERHNGESSKKRALTNRRVAIHRKNETQKVTQPALQKALPEEEEEEEEEVKDKNPPNPPRGREPKKSYPYPEQLNSHAWDEWKAYRRENRFNAYQPTERSEGAAITNLINLSGGDHQTQMLIVQQSMANGWKGLFELKNHQPNPQQSRNDLDWDNTDWAKGLLNDENYR